MKVAITSEENDVVCHHFGRTPYFYIVEIEDGKVIKKDKISNPGYVNHSPGQVPAFVAQQGADWIVTGGMGPMAIQHFNRYGINVVTGITGTIDSVIERILNGTLEGGESLCDHAHMSAEEHQAYHHHVHG